MEIYFAGNTGKPSLMSGSGFGEGVHLFRLCNDTLFSYVSKKDCEAYFQTKRHYTRLMEEKGKSLFELYLVGPEKQVIMDYISEHSGNFLFSFLTKVQGLDKYKSLGGKIFIDSGAFTAWTKGIQIDTDEYIKWLNEHSDVLDLFGQVDVIPGKRNSKHLVSQQEVLDAAEKTWENYLYMRERLDKPKSLLYTFHVGEPFECLQRALEWKDAEGNHIPYIALGGMVGKNKETRSAFLRACFDVIKQSTNPDVKVHAFGMTDIDLLKKYPIQSADSTSWIMVGAMGAIMSPWGTIIVSNHHSHKPEYWRNLDSAAQDRVVEFVKSFGFNLEEIADDRDFRIVFNGMYMMSKIEEVDKSSRTFTKKKKLF